MLRHLAFAVLGALGVLTACSGPQQPESKPAAAVSVVEVAPPDASAAEVTEAEQPDAGAEPVAADSPSSEDAGTIGLGQVGTIGGSGVRAGDTGVPRLRVGSAQVKGSLENGVIRRVIRRHLPRFRACYERELKRDPSLQARVQIRFVITTSGSVGPVMVQTGSGNGSLDQCLTAAIAGMVFPAPQGGIVIVSYPFVFEPR